MGLVGQSEWRVSVGGGWVEGLLVPASLYRG